ncbi:MAG: hypothetical protein L0L69_06165, partial [Propionibacterium sp.]|nr:hypothetical protein [Propionibacterium sp.]
MVSPPKLSVGRVLRRPSSSSRADFSLRVAEVGRAPATRDLVDVPRRGRRREPDVSTRPEPPAAEFFDVVLFDVVLFGVVLFEVEELPEVPGVEVLRREPAVEPFCE